MTTPSKTPAPALERTEAQPRPATYEPPRILRKCSFAQVTLTSGEIGGCNPQTGQGCGGIGGY